MKPERWQHIDRLFHAALKRPPQERETFLREACGEDEPVRLEVEALIAAQERSSEFLDTPAYDNATEELTIGTVRPAVGQILGRYKILDTLGAGGMGEVWLAEDTRLDRRVALKLLPAEFTQDAERVRRFVQEAKAASALNHPNIITVYDIGACETGHFIVMELIAGCTLRTVIASDNSIETLLTLGSQMARALSAAHAAGITHRDIKPDNIMVRDDGYVKMLDFGLARLLPTTTSNPEDTTLQQTTPGRVMGTVAYMSPEQASGQRAGSPSDVFSLGVVLYELATGRHPFKSETVIGYLHAITLQTPLSITSLKGELPAALDDLILRMLEKEASNRPTASEVTQALQEIERYRRSNSLPTKVLPAANVPTTMRELTKSKRSWVAIGFVVLIAMAISLGAYLYFSRKAQATIQSIAVMPFINESGNADVEYLSDGMTETLIASLSQLPNLSVKARSTVFYYKGKETSPKKVGADLDVQAVLLGRVAQRGSDLKLNLELVDTTTQDVIWSEQYNRKQSDLLKLQGEIARDVSSKLKTKLSGAEMAKLTKTYTANPAAYELYLKGKYYANRYTKEGLGQSIDCFNQAIAIDPNYSSAYSGLAYTYILMDDWFMSPNQSAPKAREAARKALEINETDVDAHVVLGLVAHWYDWDWSVAEKELKRSIELNPRNSESYLYYSYLLSPMGRPDEAEAIARQGLQIDPLSSGTNFGVASALVFNRRWDEAIVHLRKAIEQHARMPALPGGTDLMTPFWSSPRSAGKDACAPRRY